MRTWTRIIDLASKREEIFFDNRNILGASYVDSRDIKEGKKIGEGFSTVREAEWQGRKVALKKLNVDSTYHSVSLTSKEVNRMLSLQHPNVIELLGAYLTTQEGQVVECTMIMELMDCDLEEFIGKGPLSNDQVVYIFAKVAKGMNRIHEKGCFHRDLKPTNVLLKRSVVTGFYIDVKIADFRSSELLGDGDIKRTAGTLGYKAPEQFDSTSELLPEKVDVFGFGALCFKVLTSQKPYESPINVREAIKQIDRGAISHQNLPEDVVQLIWECLDVNPELRPDFEEIFRILDYALATIWQKMPWPWPRLKSTSLHSKKFTLERGGIMEDSPSPLQPGSSHSEDVLESLHSSLIPRFMLEAVDNTPTSHEISHSEEVPQSLHSSPFLGFMSEAVDNTPTSHEISHSEEVPQSSHSSPIPRFMSKAPDNTPTSHKISHSKEVPQSLHSSLVPRFISKAVDNTPTSHEIELPKHYLPDFNFRIVNGLLHPTTEQFIEVASYFPGCTNVAYTPPFLVVLWVDLPRKPWPLTFARLPLFYGTLEDRRPPTYGRVGGSQPIRTFATDYLEPGAHPQGKIKEVFESLVERGIGLHYFGWSGVRWYAEVLSATDGAKLPSKICGLLVLWKIWENKDSEFARVIVPSGGDNIIDTTSYAPRLRPGILVESRGGKRTTSGIPLLAPNGDRYITVANHGFPPGDVNVYHPNYGRNTLIARIVFSYPNSDIALAKLEENNTYSSTSFDGDALNGITLNGLIHSNNVPLLTSLFLDSPFNGKCEGIVTSIGFHVLPPNPINRGYRYVECNMTYFGNGANDIVPGTCGSPMWTIDKKVAAFFRWYYSEDAIAFSPVVDIFINSGYVI